MDGQLYHHGVKGQRWGVRRYQNADGSLTPAGKSHYNSIASAITARRDARRKFNNAQMDLISARIRQVGAAGRVAATHLGGNEASKKSALKEYRKVGKDARRKYADSVDALANLNASKALTQRGAIRRRQNTYQMELGMNAFSLTKNGKEQYNNIVKKSQTVNGKSITEELVRRGKMQAYLTAISYL